MTPNGCVDFEQTIQPLGRSFSRVDSLSGQAHTWEASPGACAEGVPEDWACRYCPVYCSYCPQHCLEPAGTGPALLGAGNVAPKPLAQGFGEIGERCHSPSGDKECGEGWSDMGWGLEWETDQETWLAETMSRWRALAPSSGRRAQTRVQRWGR